MSKDLENKELDEKCCEPVDTKASVGVPYYKTPKQKAKYERIMKTEHILGRLQRLNNFLEYFIKDNGIVLKKDKELSDRLTIKISYEWHSIDIAFLELLGKVLLANKQNEVQVLEHLLELQEEYADLENKEEDSNE